MENTLRHISYCLLICASLAGCSLSQKLPKGPAPPDFSLIASIRLPPNPEFDDAEAYNASFAIESNRTLRAAKWTGDTTSTHPETTLQLSPTQFQAIYDLAREIKFNPLSDSIGSLARIQISVTANDQQLRDYIPLLDAQDNFISDNAKIDSAIKLIHSLRELSGIENRYVPPSYPYER